MFKRLGELPVGTLVKDPETIYYGKPIVWKIADKNHSGYPSNTVTLISDKILSIKAFDGIESKNSDSNRRDTGNNYYKHSNLLQWLNSGKNYWYTAQHGADAPPSSGNVWSNYNTYDSEPGFLYNFSSNFKNAMVSTSLKTARSSTDGGGSETVTSKIFLASTTEVGLANENGIAEGAKFPIFDGDESRKANPTPEAVSKSEYTDSSLNASSPWYYWLRTPYTSYSYSVRLVNSRGSLSRYGAYIGRFGVRPLCNLKSDILVSDKASDGAYTIIWNQPPKITSSSGTNLGTKNGSFSVKYKLIDPDEKGNLSVEEYLDENKIRNFTASPWSEHSIKLEQSKYFELKNGDHELKVKVKDSSGGDAQKTFKFNKNETEILFELDKPLDADDMPTKAMINWQGKVPKEATVTIEICNNGYDKNPTWENVSEKVALKRKYFLSNKEKTADKWGLNVRVNIKRNGAKGDCYISSIGGNFE